MNCVSVPAAAETAVDHYSMTKEICEVDMSHKIPSQKNSAARVQKWK